MLVSDVIDRTDQFNPGTNTSPSSAQRGRFRTLVQSPLRASLLRYLNGRPREWFDVETLMQAFGRIRVDVENCMRELVGAGLVQQVAGHPPRYAACRPDSAGMEQLLDQFLQSQPGMTTEDLSPSVLQFREMIGRDEKMLLVFESIRTVAKTDLSVLILGPTGSGKEVIARMVHELSRRRAERFQAVSGAALPDTLFESELFGYEKGAFTGASERKLGRIELANRGSLFLDEIGDLSMLAQAKLLRVLEERVVERLGGRHGIPVDFRLVSATNRPLDLLMAENQFREDLYYRINGFTIRLPALKERPIDIPLLAGRFLASYCAAQGLPSDAKVFSQEALDLLMSYSWPGNIRELETTVSRAAVSARDSVVQREDVQFLHTQEAEMVSAEPEHLSLRDVEIAHIQKVLDRVHWNKKRAAKLLQISRETLYRKIAEHSLQPSLARPGSSLPGSSDCARVTGRREAPARVA